MGIADIQLGRDAAALIALDALRISHGFVPYESSPMPRGKGFHIEKWKMFEVSLVSIPSNDEAVIRAFEHKQLSHPLTKGWAEGVFRSRKKTVTSGFDAKAGDKDASDLAAAHKDAGCACKTKEGEPDARKGQ